MKLFNIFESSKENGNRLQKVDVEKTRAKKGKNLSCVINIEKNKVHQIFKGFGCAITESAGYVLSFLPESEQKKLAEECFSPDKNNYVFARTHMNSCDFSLENWACVPQKDESLESFSFERTDEYITPLLKLANQQRKNLSVIVTPWTPPAWMKTNNDMNHGGKLKRKYRQLWADYFVRFIKGLQERGLSVNHVSIQNECEAVQPWDSCIWTGAEEGAFAADYLKPTFKKNGLENVKILVWDHNRENLVKRMKKTFAVKGAEEAVDGMAFHWYSGDQYNNVAEFAKCYPEKDLFFTEGCIEGGSRPGKWFCGERYAHNIINDLNNGCNAWIDWNMALDMEGGPNHVGNFCDAPILINTETKEVLFQNTFYYIGHFSRFITPGSKRVECKINPFMVPACVDGRMGNMIEATSFITPEGKIILVVMNRTEDEAVFAVNLFHSDAKDKKAEKVYISTVSEEKADCSFVCPARGIQTYIFE